MTTDVGDRSTLPAHPVRPRHAASLVLLKGDLDGPEALLGRHPMASRFMPGVYASPALHLNVATMRSLPPLTCSSMLKRG
jgi:hypothetical protein